MRSPVSLCALTGLLAFLPAASGQPVSTTLVLTEDGVNNKVTIGLSIPGFGSSSDVTTLTGTLEVDLVVDPATGEVAELTVTSGDLTGTPVSLNAGNVFAGYAFTSTVLGGTVFTPTPPGTVDPPTGSFDATQHSFEINQGSVSGNIFVFFVPQPQSVDFATEPVTGTGSGTGSVVLSETGSTATTRTFSVVTVLDIDLLNVIEVTDPITTTVTVTGAGTIKAEGEITVPLGTLYELWAMDNGIAGAPFSGDANSDGVGNGLLWALGLQAEDDPLPFLPTVSGTTVRLELPPGGTAAELLVETSTTLIPGAGWLPVAPDAVSTGTNPIPAGTTGPVTVDLPAGDPVRGLRLRADEP